MSLFTNVDGATPLTPEEQSDLIPDLSTKQELNEWELQNTVAARTWALSPLNLARHNPLTEAYLRNLHTRMFDQTWKWAGRYRATEKNIGIPHYRVREALMVLLGDVQFWLHHATFELDEIAIRLHHQLVYIHPFPNGNGRHARLLADVVARVHGRQTFSWGGASIGEPGELRHTYIEALRAADKGELQMLLAFARR